MTKPFPWLLLVISASLFIAIVQLSDLSDEAEAESDGEPHQLIEFDSLPLADREAFLAGLERAKELFKGNRILECLNEIEKLHAIYDRAPASHNLQGACYVWMRSLDKARNAFAKAAKADPGNLNIQFNLAEIEFVSRDFEQALSMFEGILTNQTDEPANEIILPLIKFKVLLCRLAANDVSSAGDVIADSDLLEDSPLYCYGKAALAAHAHNDLEAAEWIARAGRIFRDPAFLWSWDDTFQEYGYAPTIRATFHAEAIPDPME